MELPRKPRGLALWSVTSLIILFIFLLYKGIHVNFITKNYSEHIQNRNQLSINLFISTGHVEWKYKLIGNTMEEYCIERSKLSPEQSYFSSREIEYGLFKNKYYLIYPEFQNR